jgi:hypothetical protein
MTNHITCEQFADRLADFMEREVDDGTRVAMESHALDCGECGPLLADLRKLRIDASALPELAPARDLWSGIAARIDAPVIPIGTRDLRGAGRSRGFGRRWGSLAAAAILVAITASTTYYLTVRTTHKPLDVAARPEIPTESRLSADASRQPDSAVDASVGASKSVASVASRDVQPVTDRSVAPPTGSARLVRNKLSAEEVYDREIGRLRVIVERRRAQLDPLTVSVIERNLKVIDEAIAQCKLALAKDPASRFLIESLNNALENKVELLRTAATLPSRT